VFIRYELDRKPVVEKKAGRLLVSAYDPVLGAELEIPTDLLVLSSRIDANRDNETLSQAFKVPLTREKFFLEAHVKLRPVDFATEGIYVAGMAHNPKTIEESISQAQAAAARASTIVSKKEYQAEATIAAVNEDLCDGCGICVGICEYNALEIVENPDGTKKVKLSEAACKGCGGCVAACPSGAMEQKGFKNEQIMAEIDAALA
jgi:heterodisulfide reductase subunit A